MLLDDLLEFGLILLFMIEALGLLEQNSSRRFWVDWEDFTKTATTDAYSLPALKKCIKGIQSSSKRV